MPRSSSPDRSKMEVTVFKIMALEQDIRSIVTRIQGLIDKFNALSPATKETIVKVALVAAALGPLLVVVGKTMVGVGKLMQLVANLPSIIAGAKAAFTSFGAECDLECHFYSMADHLRLYLSAAGGIQISV